MPCCHLTVTTAPVVPVDAWRPACLRWAMLEDRDTQLTWVQVCSRACRLPSRGGLSAGVQARRVHPGSSSFLPFSVHLSLSPPGWCETQTVPTLDPSKKGTDGWTAGQVDEGQIGAGLLHLSAQGGRREAGAPKSGRVAQMAIVPMARLPGIPAHPLPGPHLPRPRQPLPCPLAGLRWLSPWQPCSFNPGIMKPMCFSFP